MDFGWYVVILILLFWIGVIIFTFKKNDKHAKEGKAWAEAHGLIYHDKLSAAALPLVQRVLESFKTSLDHLYCVMTGTHKGRDFIIYNQAGHTSGGFGGTSLRSYTAYAFSLPTGLPTMNICRSTPMLRPLSRLSSIFPGQKPLVTTKNTTLNENFAIHADQPVDDLFTGLMVDRLLKAQKIMRFDTYKDIIMIYPHMTHSGTAEEHLQEAKAIAEAFIERASDLQTAQPHNPTPP